MIIFAMPTTAVTSNLRLAELMAALSIATDFGMGQPLEFALQACVVAMRLGEQLALSNDDLRATYYQSLLRYIGCNAETHLLAAVFGDELAMRTEVVHADNNSPAFMGMLLRFMRQANAGASTLRMAQALVGGMAQMGQAAPEFFAGHCEVACRLAERIGFETRIVNALKQVYARWDGKGIPSLKGEAIAPSLLVVSLAQDALWIYRLGGLDAAIKLAQERKGRMYAPRHVEVFRQHAQTLFKDLETEISLDTILAMEPGRPRTLSETEFDQACEAIADYTDLKSPWLLGHSTGVAKLVTDAAQHGAAVFAVPVADVTTLRRAALLHDIGRVGVSAGIWGKAGSLTDREWEKVRLHPYHTERILARPVSLATLGALASLHHERLDGSGYHRGANAAMQSPAARLLAAADVYQAMTEARPHRPARTPEQAADELRREAKGGRLDSEAVNHVLAAAGHHVQATRKDMVGSLSEREIEVLRLITRGMTMKQIAAQLTIAPKTVDSHIQHIYTKIGVSTRAGATLYAMENNLL
jgi:HD-GYP domain-containing protein (c-di-GMP phosphodiesterase class II)